MGNYATARDFVAARLATVTDVGVVHTHEKLLTEPAKYLEAFAGTFASEQQIRGWVVTLEGIAADLQVFNQEERTYTFVCYGIMSVHDSDDTEETFYDLVEAVMDALDNSASTLGLSGSEMVGSRGPASARNLGYRQFGSVFCHYGEVVFSVTVGNS